MAFWKFGFHSQSAIDSILSSSAANQHAHSNQGCSTPSTSSPAILLDKLLEEDDLLQEVKAQHPKLVEFLGTKIVVERMLSYISGIIFHDEDDQREAESSQAAVDRLSNRVPSPANPEPSSSSPTATFLNSFRGGRVVGDTISALLMDALDSEGRTPEDRAKAERRRVRFPYLCTEILTSDLWSVTSQIFSDPPRFLLLTRFWDDVLDQPPSVTAAKTVQIGYWAKTNIALINFKPNEMISFLKSYPSLIQKLITHFDSSPVVDVLIRIIQCEESVEGIIDWLLDSTDFVELIIGLLHPACSPETHLTAAEFLKTVITYCTSNSPSVPTPPNPVSKAAPGSSPPSSSSDNPAASSSSSSSDSQRPVIGPVIAQPPTSSNISEDGTKVITTRLMRELSKPALVSRLLSFGLDTVKDEDGIITDAKLTSSLVNSLSVLIDLIRRNNSDYSEHQLMAHLREDSTRKPLTDEPDEPSSPLYPNAPRIVPLDGLLNSFGDRLGQLQDLIRSPRSSLQPISMVAQRSSPLTLERFRIVELYAELLHCSNMGLLNRRPGDPGPIYDEDGALIGGLSAFLSIFENSSPTTTSATEPSPPPTKESNLSGSEDATGSVSNENSEGNSRDSQGDTGDQTNIGKSDLAVQNEEEPKNSEPDISKPTSSSSTLPKQKSSLGSLKEEELTAGGRMKSLFLEHKILSTVLDLFFEFPWNNFLHHVIYDLIQQVLNAKFEVSGGLSSLELTKSLFDQDQVKIFDRLIEGVENNRKYAENNGNVRLGNMAHLILIADEIWKTLESKPDQFQETYLRLKEDSRWMGFVEKDILEARKHANLTLGGAMPISGGLGGSGLTNSSGARNEDDENGDYELEPIGLNLKGIKKGVKWREKEIDLDVNGDPLEINNDEPSSSLLAPSSFSASGVGFGTKGQGFARYLVEQISPDGTDKYCSSSDDDDEDVEIDQDQNNRNLQIESSSSSDSSRNQRFPQAHERSAQFSSSRSSVNGVEGFGSEEDEWDHENHQRRGRGGIGNQQSRSDESVISNPSLFGFDDRFDAPGRTFPQRFIDFNDEDLENNGFDDDFGPFETPMSNQTNKGQLNDSGTSKSKSSTLIEKLKEEEKSEEKETETGDENEGEKEKKDGGGGGGGEGGEGGALQEEEEWGEFSNSSNIFYERFGNDESEREWSDFDLKLN